MFARGAGVTWLISKIVGNPLVLVIMLVSAFVAGATSGSSAAWYIQSIRLDKAEAVHARYVADVEKNAAESRRLELDKERFWTKGINDAESMARTKIEQARADRVAADRVAGELRDTVSTLRGYLADASREAAVAAAAACGKLLDACAAEYRSVGEGAQGHAIDVETLIQAWPK